MRCYYKRKTELLIMNCTATHWLKRNSTAHDYGQAFAEETLTLVKDFLVDVENLRKVIENA